MTFKKPHYYLLLPSLLLTGHVMAASPSHCNNLSTVQVDPKYPLLHVASPDWQEQIIYFVMPDRFYDGDPSNNDQGANEYDPTDSRKYSGGDLRGVADKLAYIKGLGATAIWITPPVANLWWCPKDNYGGYHGYWARHFKQVDEHLGTLDDYKALSNALHQNGMYLIQDVVANHTGNFFGYTKKYNPAFPTENFTRWNGNVPTPAPTQAPFEQNDVRNPKHRAAAIYHWCPNITDFNEATQVEMCGLADLDDLNTENPVVRQALRDSYGWWIKVVGVDGFRLDTAKHVPHPFWHDFFYSKDAKVPGINDVAKQTGRCDFLSFGEAYDSSKPFDDAGELKVFSYLGTPEKPEIQSMLQFPLAYTIKRVFAEGKPTAYLGYRLNKHMELSGNPYITPLFIDNHDQARFASKGSRAALKQALTFIMTIPGMPVIWQGTEQALLETRASMFANGYGSGGQDHFDTESEMYQFIKKLAHIRKNHRVFTRGSLKVLTDESLTGIRTFVYQRKYKDITALVVFNTSKEIAWLDTKTELPAGSQLKMLMGERMNDDFVVDKNGRLATKLPARAALVLIHQAGDTMPIETANVKITVTTPVQGKTFTEDMVLNGTVTAGVTDLKLVVDGFLERAIDFNAEADGHWQVVLPVSMFGIGEQKHTLNVYAPTEDVVSNQIAFKSHRLPDNVIHISKTDSAGDDRGLQGTYHYPTDKSFTNQMDIQQVDIIARNTTLDITFTMPAVTDGWTPPNGFDHVSFNVYFDLPNQKTGLSMLPKINANAPDGFQWDYTNVVYSGGNSFHSTEHADADNLGKPVNGAADIRVDKENGTIRLRYDAFYFGLENWNGVKVYATTWDIDGIENVYRPLKPKANRWNFGGGNGNVEPLIMDNIEVIVISTD
jgi:glycosidase